MEFCVNVKGKDYTYDLGDGVRAQEACRGLEIYKKTGNYGDLRRLFADLAWVIKEGNPNNKNACLATQALALSVFKNLDDSYQKLFVAISVTNIYVKANLREPEDWVCAANKYGNIIKQSMDQKAILDAGLAYFNRTSRKLISPPIPEYSKV